jgi:rod shape-determining protein MreC
MQKSFGFFLVFLCFLSFSVGLFFLFRNNAQIPGVGLINNVFSPVRRGVVGIVSNTEKESTLKAENDKLRKELRDQQKNAADLKALRDQFEMQKIRSNTLLPAAIVGMKGFVPGVSLPEGFILARGAQDGVKVGQVVIYQDNVIGKVSKITQTTALVDLVYTEQSTVNAKTLHTNAIGLIRGEGQGVMSMQGVVLSEKLDKGDEVLTKGDEDLDKTGYPPDLVIGKVVSVDKKASNLFQSAQVESLVPITKLTTVFIMMQH